jgi:hypothetical protein
MIGDKGKAVNTLNGIGVFASAVKVATVFKQ